jgi:signal transduction histidine kinase
MSASPSNQQRRPTLVLNVNDTPAALYFTSKVLRNAGFDVLQAQSGEEALALARDHEPELVLLDIRLPDIDGLEVARRLRSEPTTQSIPIVHTSATFVTSERKVAGLEAGADAYLTQPFEAIELVALVRSLLRMRVFEVEAREKAEALLVADRRKNEFMAMLAHELRNPLSAIGAAISLLKEDDASGRTKRIHQTLERQASHLSRLVDDLLDLSRINHDKVSLRKTNVDLREIVTSVVDGARPRFEAEGVRLDVRCTGVPPVIDGDPTRLEQVVLNLVDNALKYTPSGGAVDVVLDVDDGRPTARLSVKDTGVGIEPEHLENLFQLFFQGDPTLARTQGGLGIGLTMVRRLVEIHGGTILATSKGRGQGSTFVVELPIVARSAIAPVVQPRVSPPSEHYKVLLVDDNIDSCELFQFALETLGHTVEVVHDGADGLAKLETGVFDVAVVDIGLPTLDGYELARLARQSLGERTPRLIAMTGYGRPEDLAAARVAGFDVHLLKPVEPTRLAASLVFHRDVEKRSVAAEGANAGE